MWHKKESPTIISTGMCTYNEILRTQKIFKIYSTPHIFLHCTSAYPSDERQEFKLHSKITRITKR